ncbi:MAG: hypothetical protein AAGJ50_10425 [Pseudomonadota bacterium]
MDSVENDILASEVELALAHTPIGQRARLRTLFALDQRLARIIGKATEPMLAQMRLSWWREMLAQDVSQRPQGDVVLDAIGMHWVGDEGALSALVDGWEHLLADPPLPRDEAEGFASGRAAALCAFAGIGPDTKSYARVNFAGQIWAISDLAAKVHTDEERDMLVEMGRELCDQKPEPLRSFKGLAVLGALGRRALANGGRPLLEGRGAGLVAARAALLGK